MIDITSSQNSIIKEVRSLKNRKDREERGLFFVEGVRIVDEALAAGTPLKYAILSESFAVGQGGDTAAGRLKKAGVRYYITTDSLFESLSDTKTPQGVLAVIETNKPDLSGASFDNALLILLDNIKDPGNMGTIIRTADAAGFTGVIAAGGCVDVYNPKVLRSTMGSVFHLPVYTCGDIAGTLSFLKDKGVNIAASHLSGDRSIFEADLTGPTAIVVGSEAEGVSVEVQAAADILVKIPMPGRAESLNASVAAAVMMFEAVRQRSNTI